MAKINIPNVKLTRRQALVTAGLAALTLGCAAAKNNGLQNESHQEFAKKAIDPAIQAKYGKEVAAIEAAVQNTDLLRRTGMTSKDSVGLIAYLSKLETQMTGGLDNNIPILEWIAARGWIGNSGGHSYGALQIQPEVAKEIFLNYYDKLKDCPFFVTAAKDINGRDRATLQKNEIEKLSAGDCINALDLEGWGGIVLGLVKFLDHKKDSVDQSRTAMSEIREELNASGHSFNKYIDAVEDVCGNKGMLRRVGGRIYEKGIIGIRGREVTVRKVAFQNAMVAYCAGSNAPIISSIQGLLTDASMFHHDLGIAPATIDGSYGRRTARALARYLKVSEEEVSPDKVRANPKEYLRRAFVRWIELEAEGKAPGETKSEYPRSMKSFFNNLRAAAYENDPQTVFGQVRWLLLAGYTNKGEDWSDKNHDRLLMQANCSRSSYLIAFARSYLGIHKGNQAAQDEFIKDYKQYLENRDFTVIQKYLNSDKIPKDKLEHFADKFCRASYSCGITENLVGGSPTFYQDNGYRGKVNALMRAIVPFNDMEL